VPHLTYRQLPDASLDEIYAAFDASGPYPALVSDAALVAEIDLRRTRAETDRMVAAAETTRRLTWAVAGLTGVIALATIALLLKGA
jgi:hypothetical protein